MGLAAHKTKDVELPDGVVVIRKLSHKKLRDAAKDQQSEGIGLMREIGPELLKALRDSDAKTVDTIQKTAEASRTNYSTDALLRKGVVSWSGKGFDVPLTDDVRVELLDDLEPDTAEALADAIFEFSRPETKVEGGNV